MFGLRCSQDTKHIVSLCGYHDKGGVGPGKRGANDQERKNHKKSVTEDTRTCNNYCIEPKAGRKHRADTLSLPRGLLVPSGWSRVHLECMSFMNGQLFCNSGVSTQNLVHAGQVLYLVFELSA